MTNNFLDNKSAIGAIWNSKSFLFYNQDPIYLQLPSVSKLLSFLTGSYENGTWIKRTDVNINASKVNPDNSHQQFLSIDINSAQKLYNDGFSLCFGDLSSAIKDVYALKKHAISTFDYEELITITAYFSPPGAIGVLHFDRQHNFFIQREGSKRWFVSEKAAIENPYTNLVYSGLSQDFFDDMKAKGYNILLPNQCGKKLYELKPGDVLYIPPGFYHSPETLDHPSLHYTLTIEPACFWVDFNKELFSKMLSSKGKFNLDYRFLNQADKEKLISDCMQYFFNK